MVDNIHEWENIYTYTHFLWTGIKPDNRTQSLREYNSPPSEYPVGGFIF